MARFARFAGERSSEASFPSQAPLFRLSLFDAHVGSIFDRFWSGKGAQNGAKILEKSICSRMSASNIALASLSAPFLT